MSSGMKYGSIFLLSGIQNKFYIITLGTGYFVEFVQKYLSQYSRFRKKKRLIQRCSFFKCFNLTHYRPAMPFGNRKTYFRGSFQFSIASI